jgi:D-serine dehydratase
MTVPIASTLSRSDLVWRDLASRTPTFWMNDRAAAIPTSFPALGLQDVLAASARWRRFEPVLASLFPESAPQGIIESELLAIDRLAARFLPAAIAPQLAGRVLLKSDHLLPVAGSVKARGGVYEVLCVAERVAFEEGILTGESDDYSRLTEPRAAAVFGRYQVLAASTGNLGYAVGVMSRALGFQTAIHMSAEAAAWKKKRLRSIGAQVVEHATDYTAAISAAREDAARRDRAHFVDDERSVDLFLGYSAAAFHVAAQLRRLHIEVNSERPLCVYLPCGVGGAPGGILFGLRALLGDAVLGFFAEPTASPCMLLRLLQRLPATASVYDIGLDNRTVADGLAVARASDLVAEVVGPQLAGAYTASDAELLEWMARAHELERLRLEPSAAAGLAGALKRVWEVPLPDALRAAITTGTHIAWATGGGQLPDEEFRALLARAAVTS